MSEEMPYEPLNEEAIAQQVEQAPAKPKKPRRKMPEGWAEKQKKNLEKARMAKEKKKQQQLFNSNNITAKVNRQTAYAEPPYVAEQNYAIEQDPYEQNDEIEEEPEDDNSFVISELKQYKRQLAKPPLKRQVQQQAPVYAQAPPKAQPQLNKRLDVLEQIMLNLTKQQTKARPPKVIQQAPLEQAPPAQAPPAPVQPPQVQPPQLNFGNARLLLGM